MTFKLLGFTVANLLEAPSQNRSRLFKAKEDTSHLAKNHELDRTNKPRSIKQASVLTKGYPIVPCLAHHYCLVR